MAEKQCTPLCGEKFRNLSTKIAINNGQFFLRTLHYPSPKRVISIYSQVLSK